MKPEYLFATAAILGLILTWLSRQFAWRYGIVNQPNAIIPQHNKPIAYLGGVGIYLGVLVASLFYGYVNEEGIPYSFLVLGFAFILLGLFDDLFPFNPIRKFAMQIVLAGLAVWSGACFPFSGVFLLDSVISAFWILMVVNAFNLTDVCDGLLGGLSIIVLLFIAATGQSDLAIICAGATAGFLVFNFPPASIFMGDAGSHLLGFVAAYFSLTSAPASGTLFGFVPIAFLCGVSCFELVFLVIIRQRKGLKWWLGSSDHFSLRLQASGKTKLQTDLIGWVLGVVCGIPLVVVTQIKDANITYLLAVTIVISAFAVFWRYLLKIEQAARD